MNPDPTLGLTHVENKKNLTLIPANLIIFRDKVVGDKTFITVDIELKILHSSLTFFCNGSGTVKLIPIRPDTDPQHCLNILMIKNGPYFRIKLRESLL